MIIKQDNDSIYIAADTLFSARLTDLYRNDPAKLKTFRFYKKVSNGKDSTNKDSTRSFNTGKDSIYKDSTDKVSAGRDSTSKDSTYKVSISKDSINKDAVRKGSTGKDSTYKDSFDRDIANKDSTNRYFEAYRNVRVFSDSVQTVSDSLFYSFVDSTFRLYYDPVVWSKKSQITGDTIYLYTKNKKASRVQAFENSFLVNEVQGGVYNQIKSSRMDGHFKDGSLDSVRAKGLAESIYFIQDEDSAYTGSNQTKSDAIDIYFEKGDLYKVVFRSDLKGTLYPITQKKPDEMRLPNFKWLINRRPKTKYDLFQ
jgi:hypothetical protein